MCAGPATWPQRRRLDEMELRVRLAKRPEDVDGIDRSTQQPSSLPRVHGV
jgi:hypothetical protein